ncbi:hypothetical protein [Actinokineospora sp. UTMC 2448]|uniref:hypothetical protein n=1 Tax=Actinokineospora sp. UTMC 2448 TaxID=2268449 RepID=UPI002164422C|nr:hypothetical protein [Actinokineospora sp. UTMC 2448]UVS76457.1 hypothetical protein Actkin_00144 [Actinokineospora sp. UTMC 2448]
MTDNDRPPPYEAPEPEDDTPDRRSGSISYQDPRSTVPRPPTLAEQRARQEAQRRARDAEYAAAAEAEDQRKKRKRIMIGAGVTVGVVGLVAILYAASQPDEVTAHCVNPEGVIVDDDYCDDDYARSHGGYVSGGFIYIGGTSYRYNYGGTGTVGQRVSGGSFVAPSSGTTVKTGQGKTVQRGGLGVGGGGKSGGS